MRDSWYLPLSRDGWSSNNIYHFRSALSSFQLFMFQKNDAATLQPVIKSLRNIEMSICECCRGIGHKSDACIICGPKFLLPNLSRKMIQFNALHGDKTKEPPIE